MTTNRNILALTQQLAVCTPALVAEHINEAAFVSLTDQGIAAWEQAQAAMQRNDLAGARLGDQTSQPVGPRVTMKKATA